MNKQRRTCIYICVLLILALGCEKRSNPLVGAWKSLWTATNNKNLDLTLTFDNNNAYHVLTIGGGGTENIWGKYKVINDTLFLEDAIAKPVQICDYGKTGAYLFTAHNDSMLFTTINDDCERRKITLEIGLIKSK